MQRRIVGLVFCLVVFCHLTLTLVPNMHAGNARNVADFDKLVDSYFDFYFQFHPKDATAAGFHQYDAKLEDYSLASREGEISNLRTFDDQLNRLDPSKLPAESAGDLAFLQSTIKGRLLELQVIQMWRKDPSTYVNNATESIFVIIKRNFAPPEERLRSVVARERQIPAVLAEARTNLANPPAVYTRIAIEQMPGIIDFFQKDVPGAFPGIKDAALWSEFQQTNVSVIKALENFQSFLQNEMLPIPTGTFALARRIFARNFLMMRW